MTSLPMMNEEEAREYIEGLVWPEGATCSHCQSQNVVKLQGKSTRPGVYKCRACKKQFTVTTGSIFENSRIPLSKWVMAIHLMCASKKGVSSHQLHRMLGITYKCAWHMTHRIRLGMTELHKTQSLTGIVEVDETYVGGKDRGFGWGKDKVPGTRGRGSKKKTPVLVMVSREGKAISHKVERVNAATLKGAILENVERKARIVTDQWVSYQGIGAHFEGGHQFVNHAKKEYVRGDVYTNTAESYFSLMKRGVYGTFHHLSKGHLDRYCNEFSFRWNTMKVTDSERRESMIKMVKGKTLPYQELVYKEAA
jgi:transposase-like protein